MSEPSNSTSAARRRGADFRLFTSERARTFIRNEGLELVEYRKLRNAQQESGAEWN
jgi:hypothetical protein